MKIALIQNSAAWENIDESIHQIQQLVSGDIDSDLLIFPEMTLTGFTMNAERFAEELDGKSTGFFIELSAKLKKHIIAGIIENNNGVYYNNAVHFDRQGLITARYRKIHPYSYAGENKQYRDSRELVITKIDGHNFGLTVCYDLRFPELYRLYTKNGTEAFINIANWPVPRIEHWNHLLKARAIENLCYMIGCNRTGTDPENEYSGQSAVYGPLGLEIKKADSNVGITIIEINFENVKNTREKFGFLNDIKLI